MEREANIKGVKFSLRTSPEGEGFVASVTDCPGMFDVYGVNERSALTLCEVRLEKFVGASQRSAHQLRVDKMQRLIGALRGSDEDGQRVPLAVVWNLSSEGRLLRARLMLEEVLETVAALGVAIRMKDPDEGLIQTIQDLDLEVTGPMDLVAVVDGCLDTMVVTTGTLSSLGVPDEPGQELIDNNNLSKFGPGCSVRDDGKLIKPPGFKAPDLAGWLESLPRES